MEWYFILGLILTGIVGGFINTTAGGGSLFLLPMLMFLGLPPTIANGTNRIAIFLQNVVSVRQFHQKKIVSFKSDYRLVIPAVLGAIVGTSIAVEVNEKVLKTVIAGLMFAMLFTIVFNPNKWLKDHEKGYKKPSWGVYILFFFIGIYGGFIQMGVGFLLIAGVVLTNSGNLVKSVGLRSIIVLSYTIFSIIIFYINGQVNLKVGLILAIGTMIGAYIGAKVAIKGGAKIIRYVLIVAIFFVASVLMYQIIVS